MIVSNLQNAHTEHTRDVLQWPAISHWSTCNYRDQGMYIIFHDLLYGWKFWQGIKFGSLAVGVETAKLKSVNDAVVLMALSGAPLRGYTCS